MTRCKRIADARGSLRFQFASAGVMVGFMAVTVHAGATGLQPKMGEPITGLTPEQLARFEIGETAFNQVLTVPEGLGPVFNKESCGNCHPAGGPGSQTVTRFGREDKGSFDDLSMFGGSLLQSQSISEECAETIPPEANVIAQRVTNGSLGYGLIEAILDADIQAIADDPPIGVSGRTHIVQSFEAPGVDRVGRFGWKAQVATILTFSADAALNELGLTNRFITEENDPNGINPPSLGDPDWCDTVADPEDGPDGEGFDFIDRVADYQRFLAPPPQTPRSGMTGETLFMQIGCARCHTPEFTTRDEPGLETALRNRTIRPYSDFLLHDMGLAADFIPQGGAGPRELRTPVLWGLLHRDPVWHDGRFGGGTFADRITAAIQEHGAFLSEGEGVVANFNALTPTEKDQVMAFLGSLGRAEFDFDGNNVIDLADYAAFADCFGGSGYTPDDACSIGDIDADGDVDEDDLAWFLLAYDSELADCNDNGVADLEDILLGTSLDENGDVVPDECQVCPADVDGNETVDFTDLLALLSNWGPCVDCPQDINGDDEVGFADLLIVLSSWGPCS